MRPLLLLCLSLPALAQLDMCEYLRRIGRDSPQCRRNTVTPEEQWSAEEEEQEEEEEEQEEPSPLARIISTIEKHTGIGGEDSEEDERIETLDRIGSWEKTSYDNLDRYGGPGRYAPIAAYPPEGSWATRGKSGKKQKMGKMEDCFVQSYKECRVDVACSGGFSCRSHRPGTRCCLREGKGVRAPKLHTTCPAPSTLGVTCNPYEKRKTTSWCEADSDCSATPVQLCCDTGCGYKMCVQSQGYAIENGIRPINNPNCPHMHAMDVSCAKLRGTNWCNSDYECQVRQDPSSRTQRFCCPTKCRYNTCVARKDGKYFYG